MVQLGDPTTGTATLVVDRPARATRPGGTAVDATSRLGRSAKLVGLALNTGARSARHAAHRAVVASPDRRETLDQAHALRTAQHVAETFGSMRGALMKLAQMVSYLDDGLPEPMRAALAGLQADAPPMSTALLPA